MKHFKFAAILIMNILSGFLMTTQAQVKITDGAVYTMDTNSLLELESSDKGVLIPRMAINDLSLPAPLTAPVPAGMLVYSIGGSVTDGFYFWTGSEWKRFVQAVVQVNEGGTGIISGTSGGIPAFTGTGTMASSGLLTQNAIVIGGGTGTVPSVLGFGNPYQVLSVNSTGDGYTHRSVKQQIGAWGYQNLPRNQTARQMLMVAVGGTSMTTMGSKMKMAYNGRIAGINVTGSAVCTAGSAQFIVFKNDAATSVTMTINSSTNPPYNYSTGSEVSFTAGDYLDIRFTSSANFAPNNSIEYISWILIEWTD